MFEVTINRNRKTITFRASGLLSDDDMQQVLEEAKWATDGFKGKPHIVLADMRGMKLMSDKSAAAFGEIIRYGREHGTVLCVHLSDSSIARLQANRLARESSPQDDCTINVISREEADKVIHEREGALGIKAS
jgi:hypothetical protein